MKPSHKEPIEILDTDEVFVFEAIMQKPHMVTAQGKLAMKFGAVPHRSSGRQGQAYAIPVSNPWGVLRVDTVKHFVDEFFRHAADWPNNDFLVTEIGKKMYGPEDYSALIELFRPAMETANVLLPKSWLDALTAEE